MSDTIRQYDEDGSAVARRRQPGARVRRRASGISLMEVTIALTILGFGLLAGASAQLSAMRMSSDSRSRTEAQYLAQRQMEVLHAMTPALIGAFPDGVVVIDPNNPIDPDPNDALARLYNRSWTVTADSPLPGAYRVNVQVTWTSSNTGTVRNVTLESLRSEI